MKIQSIKHKGLRNFAEKGDVSGIPADFITRLRSILTLLNSAKSKDSLKAVRNLNFHDLNGNMAGYSALKVNKNFRVTFKLDEQSILVYDVNLEDYH